MAVVSGCPTGSSDIADDLSLADLLAGVDGKAAAMCIAGLGAVAVVNQDIIAISVGPACIGNGSRLGRPDGSTGRSGDVGAGVSAVAPDWAGDIAAVDRPDIAADVALRGSGGRAGEIIRGVGQRADHDFGIDRFLQNGSGDNGSFGLVSVDVGDLAGDGFQTLLTLLNNLMVALLLVLVYLGLGLKIDVDLLGHRADDLGLQERLLL